MKLLLLKNYNYKVFIEHILLKVERTFEIHISLFKNKNSKLSIFLDNCKEIVFDPNSRGSRSNSLIRTLRVSSNDQVCLFSICKYSFPFFINDFFLIEGLRRSKMYYCICIRKVHNHKEISSLYDCILFYHLSFQFVALTVENDDGQFECWIVEPKEKHPSIHHKIKNVDSFGVLLL